MALVGSAQSLADHHLMNNHVFLWVTVDDHYPLVLAMAYEKGFCGLLIIEVNCESQTIKSLRSF